MRLIITAALLASSFGCFAQHQDFSPFDARYWSVVLQYPEMENVALKKDVVYANDGKVDLRMDVYQPPKIKKSSRLPAVVFLNVAPVAPGRPSVKSIQGYTSWPKLVASQGLIGISIEVGDSVEGSFDLLFRFLASHGGQYNIDADRLGVWAASANTIISGRYLMRENTYQGIKAAVLYYGFFPSGPIRKDLPVLFVVSEGDVQRNDYQNIWTGILKNNAPWTIKMASNMPHAFDLFTDTNESRILVKETISFWKDHLEPVREPDWKKSPEREVMEAQYLHNDAKIVVMMREWILKNPDSKDATALALYARSLTSLGSYAEAESIHRKRLELEPANSSILVDLVVVSYAQGKQTEAEAHLTRLAAGAPLQRPVYISLAAALFQIKVYSESVKYYEKALAMLARPATYYFIACCYAQINQKDKAFQSLTRCVESGYGSRVEFEKSPELEPIKSDARWKMLMEIAK